MARQEKAVRVEAGAAAQGDLTGSRIRDRRLGRSLRQSELARLAGISASYLNLIEHNKRRIGGKLLVDIARALEVEPSALTEGVEAGLVGALGAAAGSSPDAEAEVDRAEEFADRFPGWAGLVAAQARRIEAQERAIEALNDRLTHDPFLNASLHDVLSTVTAIRSTAAILNEGAAIEPAWRDRFHRNLNEDSRRLAEGSQALVAYLDRTADAERSQVAPLDEAEAWFARNGWRTDLPVPERGFASRAGRSLAVRWQARLAEDAAALPEAAFVAARDLTPDPVRLAAHFGTDISSVLRRSAMLPEGGEAGLVVCDGSGTPVFRRGVMGFTVPSFGAGCPLWPLYEALSRPGTPVRCVVEQVGRQPRAFLAYAAAQASRPEGLDGPVLVEATMLLLPDPVAPAPAALVGPACRTCPRPGCPARREPSVLGET